MKRLLCILALLVPLNARAADFTVYPSSDLWTAWTGDGTTLTVGIALDNATAAGEIIFQQPRADTLTTLCARHSARNAGNPGAISFRLQGVSASTGRADGSTKASGNATCTYDPPGSGADDATVQCCTMTSSYAATAGELLALRFDCPSGCDASNNSTMTLTSSTNHQQTGFPYAISVSNTGTATKQTRLPVFAVRSASRTYGMPLANAANVAFSSDTTVSVPTTFGDEMCLTFTPDSTMCSTMEVGGIRYVGTKPSAGKSSDAIIYQGTTLLASGTYDGDVSSAATQTKIPHMIRTATATLTCGTAYRACLKPNDTTNGGTLVTIDAGSNTNLQAYPWRGNGFLSYRVDGGAFTDANTRIPLIEPIILDITPPASSGGGRTKFLGGL